MKTDQEPLNSGFGAETTAEEIASGIDLRGKVCVITGGHSGIGLETTRVLVKAGALVRVGAHDMTKARNNLANMNNVQVVHLDLADPESVDRFADRVINSHNVRRRPTARSSSSRMIGSTGVSPGNASR